MRRFAALVLIVCLAGCAGLKLTSAGLDAQANGVVAALDALPAVPADARTQAQVQNWKDWLAWLAKAGSAVAKVALQARGM
uniref:Lipoprotein n=1 Tax=Desulfovibrio sp. U5L TaxID=596152 RepID=I2Q1E9_9BACT